MTKRWISHIPPATRCAYPVRHGNRVHPLVDGEPAFRRICEAVESASHSVWVTVAFIDADFEMPDGRGSFFDVLDNAAARGVDVRVLFWSEPDIGKQIADTHHFPASDENHGFLRDRGSRILARWDRVADHCHHQKSWTIDAGRPSELAFVGGINLDRGSVVAPGHPPKPGLRPGESIHDLYVEVQGPAATDVAHNFVQRWNEASERALPNGCYPGSAAAGDLPFPVTESPTAGATTVQIARSVQPNLYTDCTSTPGGSPYPIEAGECSVLEQYIAAIESARSSIYFENQMLVCPRTLTALGDALGRGVDVAVLVPNKTMPEVVAARRKPQAKPVFDLLAALGDYERFTFAGLAVNRGPGSYEDVYVHAKVALVDDCWATIGSTNTMWRSFTGDTEMNASFWDPDLVGSLRAELLLEHLGRDTTTLDDREALTLYGQIARENTSRRARGEAMEGQVFAIDPARWATD